MSTPTVIIIAVLALVIGAAVSGFIFFKKGIAYRQQQAEAAIGSAEQEAERIKKEAKKLVENAKVESANKKKQALVEAKDEIYKLKSEADKEIKDRRSEISRQERRIQQKEENLDKKNDNLERKEELLQNKIKSAEEKLSEAEAIKKSQMEILEKISEFTREQAKDYIISQLESELVHEKALKIASYEQQLKDSCDEKARNYISLAIAKCAADQVSESSISVVALPNDEMKGNYRY